MRDRHGDLHRQEMGASMPNAASNIIPSECEPTLTGC